jgi:hypothetical protein
MSDYRAAAANASGQLKVGRDVGADEIDARHRGAAAGDGQDAAGAMPL